MASTRLNLLSSQFARDIEFRYPNLTASWLSNLFQSLQRGWGSLMNTGRWFFIAYLTIAGHAIAQDNPRPLNAEKFEYSASIIRQLPSTHDQMIKGCPKAGFLELSEAGLEELRQKSGLTRSALQERLCRDIIEGIASGEISYRTWRDWINTPDTERNIKVSGQ